MEYDGDTIRLELARSFLAVNQLPPLDAVEGEPAIWTIVDLIERVLELEVIIEEAGLKVPPWNPLEG